MSDVPEISDEMLNDFIDQSMKIIGEALKRHRMLPGVLVAVTTDGFRPAVVPCMPGLGKDRARRLLMTALGAEWDESGADSEKPANP